MTLIQQLRMASPVRLGGHVALWALSFLVFSWYWAIGNHPEGWERLLPIMIWIVATIGYTIGFNLTASKVNTRNRDLTSAELWQLLPLEQFTKTMLFLSWPLANLVQLALDLPSYLK